MLRKIKSYYYKDGLDYTQGNIDPFKYHSTFYFFLDKFQVGLTRNSGYRAYLNQNAFLFFTGGLAAFLSLISLSHGIDTMDINHITETGTYVIVMIYKLMILRRTKTKYVQYQNLLRALKEDFEYICATEAGQKYRERFFKNQLLTWKISIFSVIFTAAIGVGMVLFATLMLVYFLVAHKPGDGRQRPLLFPFWIDGVDFQATPIYEAAFVFSNICALAYAYNYIFMIQTEIVWVRHITTKVDMIIWSIEDLLVDVYPASNQTQLEYFTILIKNRLKHIVRQHQSMYSLMDDWVSVYKQFLMYEQKLCGPVVCLTAYCSVEKLEQGELHFILILLCVGTIVLHFIPSYLCTFLANKTNSISDACWNSPFWNARKEIRTYFVLIMQRSMRPLPLQAPGFEDVSLQTYSTKMTNAYSCFNMLRQANK